MHWNLNTRYKILLEINNAVITNFSINDFFKALSSELRRHFEYDRLSIFIYDSEAQSLTHLTLADGVQPEGFEKNVRPLASGAVAKMVIQSREPVILEDLAKYSEHPSIIAMANAGLTSTMAFPLIVRNRMLGTMHMSFKKRPDDMVGLKEIFTDVSNQVAIAVGNMVTFTQLEEEKQHLVREKQYLMSATDDYQPDNFLYVSQVMLDIMKLVERVADIDAPLLITGETGTGKDYIARYIHSISPRKDHLFVKVNCPALTPSLFESELYGHVKGAFTGADTARIGRFEMADKGMIFLDEIAELPVDLQAKLLQVLQEHQIERVGDNRRIRTNFRLIAATNRNLADSIEDGTIRQDLYYRLNIIQIQLPPLRERKEDIPYLIKNMNEIESAEVNRPKPKYPDKVIDFLTGYHWPGNVRELKNLIKRMVILNPGELVSLSDIQKLVNVGGQTDKNYFNEAATLAETLAETEKLCIKRALRQTKGIVGGPEGATKILDVPKSTLQYRLKKYGLSPTDYV